MTLIENKTFDEERALYNLTDAKVVGCCFAGPRDGESALKESRDVTVLDSRFSLRYPFWHCTSFRIENCHLDTLTRAPIWYSHNGVLRNTEIFGTKCLRECRDVTLENVKAESPEFGWKCSHVHIKNSEITSEYFLFDTKEASLSNFTLHGKYSFQYVENVTVTDSVLDTKDAFWHAKNVTVKNSTVKGEYLGWYSDGLTFIGCHIIGTQPLCYCKNLTLIDCTMEDTDLSFEYSDVNATIKGNVLSVKNPHTGTILADGYGDIILEDSVMETTCQILTR